MKARSGWTVGLVLGAIAVPLVAGDESLASIEVGLTHANGLSVSQTLTAPVRPAVMPVASRRVVTLAANTGTLTVDRGLLAESLLQGATVSIGSLTRFMTAQSTRVFASSLSPEVVRRARTTSLPSIFTLVPFGAVSLIMSGNP